MKKWVWRSGAPSFSVTRCSTGAGPMKKWQPPGQRERVTWLTEGNIAEEVSKLKQQFGQNIAILGSGDLVRTLMHHHLIDEYSLIVCPLILGKGKRLFQDASRTTLRLVTSKAYTTGAVWLSYQPIKE